MNKIYTAGISEIKEHFDGDLPKIITNHSSYHNNDSANWEHDDTGSYHNYSGCADIAFSAEAEHCGWEEGYDY